MPVRLPPPRMILRSLLGKITLDSVMMLFCFTAVSAIAPSLLLVWYFQKRDLYPEPPRVLWATFFLGVLVIFPVVALELAMDAYLKEVPGLLTRAAWSAFWGVALPEELFKFGVLFFYCYRHPAFDEPMDGIVYGAVASLGFATLENVLYVVQGGAGVAIMRALTSVPSHACEGAIMGYFVGRARFASGRKVFLIAKGLLAAVVLHGVYDWPILSISDQAEGVSSESGPTGLLLLSLLSLALAVIWAWRLARRSRSEQMKTLPASAPALAAPTQAPGRLSSALLALGGFILAGIGGMITLALILAFALGSVGPDEVKEVVLGGVMIGLAPLGLGLVLFGLGILRLNQAPPRPSYFPQ